MSAQVHALKAINSRVEAPEEGAALFGPVPFKVYTQRDLERIPQLARLSPAQRFEMKVVSSVLPSSMISHSTLSKPGTCRGSADRAMPRVSASL